MYADIDIARKLAGKPDPSDFSDSDIQVAVSYADAHVDAETARLGNPWSPTDPAFPLAQEASNYFLAAWIIGHYHDDRGKADTHYAKAVDICLSIREASPGSLIVASGQYKTYPLNQKAKIFRSLPGTASTERVPFGDTNQDDVG